MVALSSTAALTVQPQRFILVADGPQGVSAGLVPLPVCRAIADTVSASQRGPLGCGPATMTAAAWTVQLCGRAGLAGACRTPVLVRGVRWPYGGQPLPSSSLLQRWTDPALGPERGSLARAVAALLQRGPSARRRGPAASAGATDNSSSSGNAFRERAHVLFLLALATSIVVLLWMLSNAYSLRRITQRYLRFAPPLHES